MAANSSASDQAFLEELRRHRAELRESMGALEGALAAPATADQARWAQRVHVALVELSGDFREHIEITEGPNGLYRDLLKTSPRLSDAVAGLTREHVLIRGQVDGLLARVTRQTSSKMWTESATWARRSWEDSSDTVSEAPISSSRPTSSTSGARPKQNPRSRLRTEGQPENQTRRPVMSRSLTPAAVPTPERRTEQADERASRRAALLPYGRAKDQTGRTFVSFEGLHAPTGLLRPSLPGVRTSGATG